MEHKNRVELIGVLYENYYYKENVNVLSFLLKTDVQLEKGRVDSQIHRMVSFGEVAKNLLTVLEKDSNTLLKIEGSLQHKKKDVKNFITEVKVNDFVKL